MKITLRLRSNCANITSAAFNVLSIFSCAFRIACVLIYKNIAKNITLIRQINQAQTSQKQPECKSITNKRIDHNKHENPSPYSLFSFSSSFSNFSEIFGNRSIKTK